MSIKQVSLSAYIVLIAIMSTGCFKSKIVAIRVPTAAGAANSSKLKVNGVTYALPRTVVKVDVPVKMTVENPGELERFAPCFFSAEVAGNRIIETDKAFNIEPATFSTRGEPDPSQHFIVKTKGGYFEHKSMLLEYTPEGVLTKGDAESKDESLEFAVATAKTIISVAAKSAAPGFTSTNVADIPKNAQSCRGIMAADRARVVAKATRKLADVFGGANAYANTAETEASAANDDAEKAKQEPSAANAQSDANSAVSHATNAAAAATSAAGLAGVPPSEKKATEAAVKQLNAILNFISNPQPRYFNEYAKAVEVNDAIERLQGQRESLVSGGGSGGGFPGGPIAPETLKLMLKETDDTIEAYQNAYFLGTSAEKIWTGPFEFTPATVPPPAAAPAPAPLTSNVFFWFSEAEGLCEGPVADALGIKIPKKFKPKGGCSAAPASFSPVAVRVERKADDDGFLANLDAAHKADENKDKERGFYYRVPAKAAAILQQGTAATTKDLSRTDLIVAQFGVVASLPASSSGRTTQYTIALDDSTGALKNFKLGSDSLLQKSLLDDATTAANSTIDAKKAREKAKADKTDELAQKKRELELLQTQNAINEEKKKAGGSGPQN